MRKMKENNLLKLLPSLKNLSPLQKEHEATKERLKTLRKMKAQEQYLTAKEKASKKDEVTKRVARKNRTELEALNSDAKDRKELIDQKQKEYDQEKPVLQKLKDLEAKKEDFDRKLQGKNWGPCGQKEKILSKIRRREQADCGGNQN